jgi:hypothetical protein
MELIMNDIINTNAHAHDVDAIKLNNVLERYSHTYRRVSHTIIIKKQIKFVLSLYHKHELLLRFEYIILGSYHKNKNVWIWADQSLTLNKTIVNQVKDFRSTFYETFNNFENHDMKNFFDNKYIVLPTNTFREIISKIAIDLFKKNKQYIIILDSNDYNDKIDILVVKRIIFEKIL